MVLLVEDARAQWAKPDRRIAAFDAEFVRCTKENEEARRLTTIPGFGPIVASARHTFGDWCSREEEGAAKGGGDDLSLALEEITREQAPQDWAAVHPGIPLVLAALGEREPGQRG
jgi:hypothetical protein